MAYPNEYGKKKSGVLPDMLGPLSVEAGKGDKLVPANDMGGVAGQFSRGGAPADPNGYVSPIEKTKK